MAFFKSSISLTNPSKRPFGSFASGERHATPSFELADFRVTSYLFLDRKAAASACFGVMPNFAHAIAFTYNAAKPLIP